MLVRVRLLQQGLGHFVVFLRVSEFQQLLQELAQGSPFL
jgi:hypothetical protein